MAPPKMPTSERIAKIFEAVLHDEPAALARHFTGHEKLAACVNEHKQTPLLLAASVGSPECVSILLPHSDPLLRTGNDGQGYTALMLLARERRPGHVRCAQLLAPVCDANALSQPKGETALMMAIQTGRREIVEVLLPFSNPAIKDRAGDTALEWAVRVGNVAAVILLTSISPHETPRPPQDARSVLSSKNPHGQSLLIRAIRQVSELRVIEALLPHYDAKEHGLVGGQTALTMAMSMKRLDIAALLLPLSDRTATVSNGRDAFAVAAHAGFAAGMQLLSESMPDEDVIAAIRRCEADLGDPSLISKTPLPQPSLDWMGQKLSAIEARSLRDAAFGASGESRANAMNKAATSSTELSRVAVEHPLPVSRRAPRAL